MKAITRHMLFTLVAIYMVAMVKLQHGVKENPHSTSHILSSEEF